MCPTEDGVEDCPARAVELVLGVAAVQVPDVPSNIVGARAITRSTSIIDIRTQAVKKSDT